ncbi:hypothetical protein CEXT_756031 [Caerostris extrusa]|uniref:Uncharacterized protein n=1 Tax=Caerostris extrusa TaxID=172846 RepID=A0AAV4R250_CAEEX|nr:hypothetical protein CEXT_756031 [Caerostris extrusa]
MKYGISYIRSLLIALFLPKLKLPLRNLVEAIQFPTRRCPQKASEQTITSKFSHERDLHSKDHHSRRNIFVAVKVDGDIRNRRQTSADQRSLIALRTSSVPDTRRRRPNETVQINEIVSLTIRRGLHIEHQTQPPPHCFVGTTFSRKHAPARKNKKQRTLYFWKGLLGNGFLAPAIQRGR